MKKIKKNRIQKILILLFIVTLIFIPKTYAIDNENLAIPDLTDKTEISYGIYRLSDLNGVTLDFNVFNGDYIINGIVENGYSYTLFAIFPNTQYVISYYAVSGTLSGGSINLYVFSPRVNVIGQINENNTKQNIFMTTTQTALRLELPAGRTFDNYTFKLQLEKGSTSSPYKPPLSAKSLYQNIYNFYYDTLFNASEIEVPTNILQILTVSTMFMIAFIPVFILGKAVSKLWN